MILKPANGQEFLILRRSELIFFTYRGAGKSLDRPD
jgi:hypothetical protein